MRCGRAVVLALSAVSCDPDTNSAPASVPSITAGARDTSSHATPGTSLLQGKRLEGALSALLNPLPKNSRLLSMTALHRQVILQVQDPEHLDQVQEYRYRVSGKVEGPNPVTLLGTGRLKDNLFPQHAAEPLIAVKVLKQITTEPATKDLHLKKVVMIRNLPRSRDIQFRVYFDAPEGELVQIADKRGHLLGTPTPTKTP